MKSSAPSSHLLTLSPQGQKLQPIRSNFSLAMSPFCRGRIADFLIRQHSVPGKASPSPISFLLSTFKSSQLPQCMLYYSPHADLTLIIPCSLQKAFFTYRTSTPRASGKTQPFVIPSPLDTTQKVKRTFVLLVQRRKLFSQLYVTKIFSSILEFCKLQCPDLPSHASWPFLEKP